MLSFVEVFQDCAKWVRENNLDATANQYLLDTGKEARRGFTYGGIHLWEHLKSSGMENFLHREAPYNIAGTTSNGLFYGDDYLPYDELKAATLDKSRLMEHWDIASVPVTERLKEVNWKLPVHVQHDNQGNSLLWYHDGAVDRAQLLGEHIPEENGYITVFHFGSCMPLLIPVIKKAKNLNIVWISDKQSVLAFDTGKIGGVISCWYPGGNAKTPQEENVQVHLGGEVFNYHRVNNQIIKKGKKKMEFKNLPNVKELTEGKKAKETTVPKVEPKEVEKPEVVMHKSQLERVDGKPLVEEVSKSATEQIRDDLRTEAEDYVEEQRAAENDGLGAMPEPTVEQLFEDLLKKAEDAKLIVADVFKELKPLAKEVRKLQKGAGNSDEVKALKAENKELQKQLKESEKRCQQLQAAVKTQAELLQKSL